MPRVSEKARILASIQTATLYIALSDPLMKHGSRRRISDLCHLRFGLESVRYMYERRILSKSLEQLSVLPYLRVPDFLQEVRVCHETFAFLVDMLEASHVFSTPTFNKQNPVWLQVACALHRLGHSGNGASGGTVARAKGVGYGTVMLYTKRVLIALKELAPQTIRWPSHSERDQLANLNFTKHGFRGGILSTDGTHVVLFQKHLWMGSHTSQEERLMP